MLPRMPLSSSTTALILDSTADLPDPAARNPNWRLVPLRVNFGDESLRDHVDMTPDEFYRRLESTTVQPKTSQPTPADFERAFAELAGFERILCVLLSGKLSGTVESARLAVQATGDERVTVIDSESVSGGTVILADAIQRRLDAGTTDEEIAELVERFKRESGTPLHRGHARLPRARRSGRQGRGLRRASFSRSSRSCRSETGEVVPIKRVRGRTKALAELERLFDEDAAHGSGLHVGVAHANSPDDNRNLADRVRGARPEASLDVDCVLGPVIGTHGGPGTLGLFWFDD